MLSVKRDREREEYYETAIEDTKGFAFQGMLSKQEMRGQSYSSADLRRKDRKELI